MKPSISNMLRFGLGAVLALAVGTACGSSDASNGTGEPADMGPNERPDGGGGGIDGGTSGGPDGGPEPFATKSARRMSVEQIERSLDVVGGFPPGSVQIPESLALTLGEPDHRSITERSFEPSPLFMKFMVDLGGFVCTEILRADVDRPLEERVLLLEGEQDERLRSIWFRFTGITGSAADPYIERLARVEEDASAASSEPGAGAMAVCLAAITSPEFLLY